MAAPAEYSGPFKIKKDKVLTIIAEADAGYVFREWDDRSPYPVRTVGQHDGDAEYVAFFISDDPDARAVITLRSSPEGAGTFTWRLPGMSRAVPYTGPFEINGTDFLTITAGAAKGYNFVRWDSGSAQRTMSIDACTEDAAYTAEFSSQKVCMIGATGSKGGSVTPSGTVYVMEGGMQMFSFVPDPGYRVSEVVVDGTPIPVTGNSYAFFNVAGDHTITVNFTGLPMYSIVVIPDVNMVMPPKGTVSVAEGADHTVYFSARDGYRVGMVLVDGKLLSQAEMDKGYYTFLNVRSNHIIQVTGVADEGAGP